MADSRKARRARDPGLQPERTSLAWLRTLLGYGALMALALRHSWQRGGTPFWLSVALLLLLAFILWRYTRSRSLMDAASPDFSQSKVVLGKLTISLAVLALSLLFSMAHLQQIIAWLKGTA